MSIWHIYGGNRLTGSTRVQGAKNAVLPIMAASVLSGGETVLHNVPDLRDVTTTLRILQHLGCTAVRDGDTVRIDSRGMHCDFIPHALMRELRSSVIFLGAILARFGTARLSMPGGCELGPRPVNLHLDALRALGADVVYNHADYRLMSRRALDALAEYKEVNLFLRGLVPLVGYPSTVVYYERGKRFAGESKYPLRKMLSFAWEGVSSLTVSPLRLITRIGVVMFLVSIAMLIYFLVRYFTGHTVAGWSSLAVSIWAIGGLQLLAIGVVGEYIGKIYLETKARPRYRIETELDDREAEL